jgi:Flp pilus assembly protein TadG
MWEQKRQTERGQTFVEFALALPILTVILFAIIQFGIVFHDYVTITDASRAGARKAAVSRNVPSATRTSGVVTAVRNSAQNLDQEELDVAVTSTWEKGEDVTVTATYPYTIRLFGLPVTSGNISSATTERVE